MGPGEIVAVIEEAFNSYNPLAETPDSHINSFLARRKLKNPTEALFVEEIFLGLVESRKLLRVTLDAFLSLNRGIHRTDQLTATIVCYIVLLRLGDMAWQDFEMLVSGLDAMLMWKLLKFVTNEDTIDAILMDEWQKIYERTHIEGYILGPMRDNREQLNALVASLETYCKTGVKPSVSRNSTFASTSIDGGSAIGGTGTPGNEKSAGIAAALKKPNTVPEPFKLTQPKGRRVPMPERINSEFKARQVPRTNYEPDSTSAKVERAKLENRERARSPSKAPALTNRPSRLPQIIEEVERERQAKIDATRVKPHTPPALPEGHGKVRLNAAALLREDALYAKKQASEMAAIKAYENNLRDASEFLEWQARMRSEDEAERLAQVEKRRLEMALSADEAAKARQRSLAEKKVIASKTAEESAAAREALAREGERIVQENKEKSAKVKAVEDNALISKRKILRENRKAAVEITEKSKELEMKRAEELVYDQLAKKDEIMRIRAQNEVVKGKVTVVDRTSTSGLGLLNEISPFELEQRSMMNKRLESERVERKRQEILEEKTAKNEELRKRAEKIEMFRQRAREENVVKRKSKQEQEREHLLQLAREREPKLVELSKKLEETRMGKIREDKVLRAEEKEAKIKAQFLAQDHNQIESIHFTSVANGQERRTRNDQGRNLLGALIENTVKEGQEKQLDILRERQQQRRDALQQTYDKTVAVARREHLETKQAEELERIAKAARQKEEADAILAQRKEEKEKEIRAREREKQEKRVRILGDLEGAEAAMRRTGNSTTTT